MKKKNGLFQDEYDASLYNTEDKPIADVIKEELKIHATMSNATRIEEVFEEDEGSGRPQIAIQIVKRMISLGDSAVPM